MVITITSQDLVNGRWNSLINAVKDTTSLGWGDMDKWFYDNYKATPLIDKNNWMNNDMYRYQFPNQESYMEFCLKWI